MNKTYVIGDIHGGLRALQQVLQKVAFSPNDTLIFLGDYVDGWSESAQTIDYLLALQKNQRCVFIKGNHDLWCQDWLKTGHADSTWLVHGGQETVKSYAGIDDNKKQVHLAFIQSMGYFYVDKLNRLYIHAGFTSMHGPKHEFHSSNFSWDRTLWEMAIAMDKKISKSSILYPKRLKLFKEIYIGHTPTLYYNQDVPMQGCNVWNIDTGAAFSGKLTMMDVATKVYWQSEQVQQLYPGEVGRNK